MQGLEEALALYEDFGRPMLREQFPQLEGRIAVGLVGHGSECYGFDDAISRDHDFARGFCLWLTDEDDLRYGVALNRAYRSLPLGEGGKHSALAEDNCGVRRTAFFYRRYTGSPGAPESWQQWLALPSHALAEATNGQVFRDDLGEFSAVRETLLHGMPEDVRKKKLAARLIEMAQTGQYNYAGAVYLLEKRHMPYTKWMLRGMDSLPRLGHLRSALEFLLTGEDDPALRQGVIEDLCATVSAELRVQGLSDGDWDYLEPHAFAVQGRIQNPEIRSLHVMEG